MNNNPPHTCDYVAALLRNEFDATVTRSDIATGYFVQVDLTPRSCELVTMLPDVIELTVNSVDAPLASVLQLASLTQLRAFTGSLPACDIIPCVKSWKSLEYFEVVCRKDTPSRDGDDLLVALSGCLNLHTLICGRTGISGSGLNALVACNSLTNLSLHDEVISGGGDLLKQCDGLVTVTVDGSTLAPEVWKNVAAIHSIRNLEASSTDLDDETLRLIMELPRLEYLGISHTPVTEKGLLHLSNCQQLKKMIVDVPMLSDASIDALAACPQLQKLRIWGQTIAPEIRKRLKKMLPKCELVFYLTEE